MKKALKLFGIIAFLALIGFSMITCGGGDGGSIIIPGDGNLIIPPGLIDGGGDSSDPINGTWKASDGETLTLNNGSFEVSQNNITGIRGTYTTAARSIYDINMAVKELHGNILNDEQDEMTFENKWYTKDQIIEFFKRWAKTTNPTLTDAQINSIISGQSASINEMFPTKTGTINGDTLALDDGTTYTKTISGGGTGGGGGGTGGGGGGTGSGSGGFTLTDIPAEYNGKYARLTAGDTTSTMLTGFQSSTSTDIILPQISNGRVSIPVWEIHGSITNPSSVTFSKYTGSGTFMYGAVNFYNSGSDRVNQTQTEIINIAFMSITFSNGNATKSWNDALGYYKP